MIHLIAAVDRNGGIGKDNDLLCHISADLKRFKSLPMGHTVLMGRKTFESLPGVLPGRPHWVLTHQKDYSVSHDAVTIFHSVEAMQQAMEAGEDYFVIGGASMYEAFLPLADSLYLTESTKPSTAPTLSSRPGKRTSGRNKAGNCTVQTDGKNILFLSSTMSAVSIDIVNPLCYTKGRATR